MGNENDGKPPRHPAPVTGPLERPAIYEDHEQLYKSSTKPDAHSEAVLPETPEYRK